MRSLIASWYLTIFDPALPSGKLPIMPTAAIELGKLPEWSDLGRNLARARRQKGLTQRGLADLCQLRQGEISAFESGRRQPTLAQITELARHLTIPLQWFVTGTLQPVSTALSDMALELRACGVLDHQVPSVRVPGAFRPFEQLVTHVLQGDVINPKLIEAIPYLLATNPWKSRLLLAFGQASLDVRVIPRIGWIADVTRALHKIGNLPEAQSCRAPLATVIKRTAKAPKPDSLGHPATDWAVVPAVYKRWNITYSGSLDSFKQRIDQLRQLRPVREE
jgi:transcriptional regulator with XRE-family HTH domain